MNEEQKALFELLVKVRDFMESKGITFYLFGGSCIGAVRHSGFIPWDDDIDIIVDRYNYEKLIECSDQIPWDDIEFVCFEKNSDYFRPFGQFSSKKDTYFLKSRVFNKGLCMGTILDVFVMDYVPQDKLEEHKKALLMYEEVLSIYRLCRKEIKDYKEEYYELVEKESVEGRKKVIDDLKTDIEKYSQEDSEYLVTRFWVNKFRCFNKEWFGEPRYVDFEGERMPIPAKAEACLRLQYGNDWYIIPKEENQKVKNFYINHNISNNNFVEDINNFINNDRIQLLLETRKHYQVSKLDSQLKMKKIKSQLKCHRLILEVFENEDIDSRDKLDILFENIRYFQLAEEQYECFDELFIDSWIDKFIYAGRYYDAIKIRQTFGYGHSGDLLDRVKSLAEALQDDSIADMESCLMKMSADEMRKIPDCLKVRTEILLNRNHTEQDIIDLLHDCREYLREYPDNYDVIKIEGDILWNIGEESKAKECYSLVLSNSRNGMDVLNLKSKMII